QRPFPLSQAPQCRHENQFLLSLSLHVNLRDIMFCYVNIGVFVNNCGELFHKKQQNVLFFVKAILIELHTL
ncbi:hypothetical protein ACFD1L_002262, partial [Salmonella enterica subsp. enterica serovar Kentucky]